MEKSSRDKAVDTTIAQIERQYGKGSIMRLGANKTVAIDTISTGSLSIDHALGVGGIPRGRVTEIYGQESSGKTTLTLHIAAEAQKAGGIVGFIDAEHALDPVYCKKLGVNIDELLISQPDTGEQALEICEMLVRSNAIDLIIIDSVAALVPKAEIEGEMGDAHMALQARLMSQALRKLTGIISKTKTSVIFINQVREKVGGYGSGEVTTGGRALKFYSSIRIEVRKAYPPLKKGTEIIGTPTLVKIVKNKVAAPFKETTIDLVFGKGFSWEGDLLNKAVDLNLIAKSGSWYSYEEQRIGQGREQAKEFIISNEDISKLLRKKVRESLELQSEEKTKKKKESPKEEAKEAAKESPKEKKTAVSG